MIDYKSIVKSVEVIIEEYQTRDPLDIIEDFGIPIITVPRDSDIKASYLKNEIDGVEFFVIRQGLDEFIIRTFLAHELGHYFQHETFSFEDYSNSQVKFESSSKETEANIFAAWFLIDDEKLKDLVFVYNYTNSQIAQYFGVPKFYVEYKIDIMIKLGQFTGVLCDDFGC